MLCSFLYSTLISKSVEISNSKVLKVYCVYEVRCKNSCQTNSLGNNCITPLFCKFCVWRRERSIEEKAAAINKYLECGIKTLHPFHPRQKLFISLKKLFGERIFCQMQKLKCDFNQMLPYATTIPHCMKTFQFCLL